MADTSLGAGALRQPHETWSNWPTFILAASGSAVGLGNIWKFPYIMGENGGGAFVLVYLLCIAAIGVPVMIAEVMIGRRGRLSPGPGSPPPEGRLRDGSSRRSRAPSRRAGIGPDNASQKSREWNRGRRRRRLPSGSRRI